MPKGRAQLGPRGHLLPLIHLLCICIASDGLFSSLNLSSPSSEDAPKLWHIKGPRLFKQSKHDIQNCALQKGPGFWTQANRMTFFLKKVSHWQIYCQWSVGPEPSVSVDHCQEHWPLSVALGWNGLSSMETDAAIKFGAAQAWASLLPLQSRLLLSL